MSKKWWKVIFIFCLAGWTWIFWSENLLQTFPAPMYFSWLQLTVIQIFIYLGTFSLEFSHIEHIVTSLSAFNFLALLIKSCTMDSKNALHTSQNSYLGTLNWLNWHRCTLCTALHITASAQAFNCLCTGLPKHRFHRFLIAVSEQKQHH